MKKIILLSFVLVAMSANAGGLSSLVSKVSDVVTDVTGTSTASIVGTWTYSEPAVSLESDNTLSSLAGTAANSTLVDKLETYYTKVGITEGKCTFVFNSDNSCTYTIGGKTYSGTYTYDSSAGTLKIKSKVSFPTGYVTISSSKLKITFDATKLLSVLQSLSSLSSSSSELSAISSIASAYDGLKLGFTFTK